MEENTVWREQSVSQRGKEEKRSDRLVGAAETSKQQNDAGFEHTGSAEKQRATSVHEESS